MVMNRGKGFIGLRQLFVQSPVGVGMITHMKYINIISKTRELRIPGRRIIGIACEFGEEFHQGPRHVH